MKVISINERNIDWCEEVAAMLGDAGFRVESDYRSEKLGFKLREAQLAKIPYMIVIGDNEMNEKVISVRSRKDGDLGTMSLDDFIARCEEEVRLKK